MNWFWFALIALLFWSGSDVFSKIGSRPEEKTSHWRMVIAVGLVMGIHAFYMIATGTEFHLQDIITYLPASACYISSMILGYVGLRYIELSLSTPICNSSGAVAAILCFIFLGQRMEPIQLFAVVLIVGAIIAFGVIEHLEDPALRDPSGIFKDIKYRKSALALILLSVLLLPLQAQQLRSDIAVDSLLAEARGERHDDTQCRCAEKQAVIHYVQ